MNIMTKFKQTLITNAIARGFIEAVANKNYNETEAHQTFVVNANAIGYTFDSDDRPERIAKSFFAAVAAYLSKVKVSKTDEAVALVLTDTAGTFRFAGIVEYYENKENEEEPGNWSFVMTFNEQDLTDLEKKKEVKKYLCSGPGAFYDVFVKTAYDVGSLQFQHSSYLHDAFILVIDTLLQVLDSEAKVGEVIDIEMPGYFTASVSVEGDEKVFAITPDGHLKAIIKDDVALEK